MTRRANRLLILALAVISMTLYYGCSQTDDILTPVSHTTLTLSVQLLPTAPDGMVYELWVAGEGDTVAVGRFNFDQNNYKFLNENGSTRADGGTFEFNGDLFDYTDILVTVELVSDPTPAGPGPIMLTDRVTNPEDNPIRLVFPLSDSLWFSTCQFNMVTPSDSNLASNIGAGVWFSSFTLSNTEADSLRDTIGLDPVDSFTLTYREYDQPDSGKTTRTSIMAYDSVAIDTLWYSLGIDSVQRIRVALLQPVLYVDSGPPYGGYELAPNYVVDTLQRVQFEKFLQADYGLIDYSSYGWHYKGWVLSPFINPAINGVATFTPPPWPQPSLDLFFRYAFGGMLTTGTFTQFNEPDNGNPYSGGPRVPPIPGEDFLQGLPAGLPEPLNLLPNIGGFNPGYVFITLEPYNYTDTTTNFPLILLSGMMPFNQSAAVGGDLVDASWNTAQPMDLFINTNNPTLGFPRIDVAIRRQ